MKEKFESPKFEEEAPDLKKEDLEVTKPEEIEKVEISEIDYPREAEREVERFKKEYGELAQKAGLSEEVFAEIGTKLEETGNNFQESENRLQGEKKKEEGNLRKKFLTKVAGILAATVIGVSALTAGFTVGEITRPPKETKVIERVEKEYAPEKIEWVKNLSKSGTMLIIESEGGKHIPHFMRLVSADLQAKMSEEKRLKLALSDLENFNQLIKAHSEKERKLEKDKVRVGGFEKLKLESYQYNRKGDFEIKKMEFSSELTKMIIEKTFPQSWQKDISEIRYIDKHNEDAAAWCCDTGVLEKSEIEFFKGIEDTYPGYVLSNVMAHELAHANGWDFDNQMSAETRIWLLFNVAKRLASKDRYHSDYVESIKKEDKQYQWCRKCQEYWAEICGEYFEYPESEHLPLKDRLLIETHLMKTDPNFDAKKSAELRNKLIEDYIAVKFADKGILHETLGGKIPPIPSPSEWK